MIRSTIVGKISSNLEKAEEVVKEIKIQDEPGISFFDAGCLRVEVPNLKVKIRNDCRERISAHAKKMGNIGEITDETPAIRILHVLFDMDGWLSARMIGASIGNCGYFLFKK